MADTSDKLILMGLGASGKSSITSIIFEGKKPEDVEGYHATIQYARTPKKLINDLQILDCGGQDSFITAFLGEEKSEFIFSDLKALIWVVDVSDSQNVSTSKYYFDTAINNILKFSPKASVYVFFHKIDLIKDDFKQKLISGLSDFFTPAENVDIHFHPTSIFDQSLYKCFGNIVQQLVKSGSKTGSVSDEISTFLNKNENFFCIAIYSHEGLPVFEEGNLEKLEELSLPANITLSTFDQLDDRIGKQPVMVSILELENYYYLFKRIKGEFLLGGLTAKDYNVELAFHIFNSLENLVMKLFA